jgi:hypothetical protein
MQLNEISLVSGEEDVESRTILFMIPHLPSRPHLHPRGPVATSENEFEKIFYFRGATKRSMRNTECFDEPLARFMGEGRRITPAPTINENFSRARITFY